MTATAKKRPAERPETNAARQRRLRDRRKAQGFKRITLWLSPEQVDSLETLGGESWLGTTVKELLTGAVSERQKPAKQAALFVVPTVSDTQQAPVADNGKATWLAEAEQLRAQGLTWAEIALRWNEQGRRTDKGAAYRGGNIWNAYQKWKGAGE